MRLGLALLAVAALTVVAVVVARRVLPKHAHTVLGSTSTEYVPSPPPALPREAGIAWPTYGYSQERTRAAPYVLRPPYRPTWTFHGRALLEFPPAVAYGRVYLPTFDGRFYALDARTGAPRWTFPAGDSISGGASVIGHTVYFSTVHTHKTFGVDVESGKQVWFFGHGAYTPAISDGQRLYLTGYSSEYGLVPRKP